MKWVVFIILSLTLYSGSSMARGFRKCDRSDAVCVARVLINDFLSWEDAYALDRELQYDCSGRRRNARCAGRKLRKAVEELVYQERRKARRLCRKRRGSGRFGIHELFQDVQLEASVME